MRTTATNFPRWILILTPLVLTAALSNAQPGGARVQWLNKKLKEMAAKSAPAAEAGSPKTQAESPSIDPGSPSIIDRSKPTEFFDLAMSLGRNNGTGGNGIATGTATATLYSVFAAMQKKSLVDPDFYEQQRHLRRVSFTLGTAASDKDKDGTTTDAAVYGLRVNLYDGTDLFARPKGRQSIIEEARSHLRDANEDAHLFTLMNKIWLAPPGRDLNEINSTFATVDSIESWIASLTANDQKAIEDQLKRVAAEDTGLMEFMNAIHNALSKPRLLSIAYYTNQRKDGGADDHRAELIYDYGFNQRINWTINAGAEYRNVYKHTGGDRKGGRFATEFQYKLYPIDKSGAVLDRWVTFDFGGEWKAMTGAKPYYKGQAKLTVPLMDGVSLPIVWSYESNITLADGSIGGPAQKKFKFGLAFDPGKLKALSK